MEIASLEKIVNIEPDYDITSFFPAEVQSHLHRLIGHRIKLLLKKSIVIHSGETQNVETACILDQKISKISMMLKSYEHIPVVF